MNNCRVNKSQYNATLGSLTFIRDTSVNLWKNSKTKYYLSCILKVDL